MARDSDRWVTPRVIVAGMVLATVLVLAVVASVTWLTVQGKDPDPMLRLVANLVGALAAVGTFVQGLANRRTTTKVERQTGRLATGVVQVVDQLELERGRHARVDVDADQLEVPIDPQTRPHPVYGGRGAAPGLDGR